MLKNQKRNTLHFIFLFFLVPWEFNCFLLWIGKLPHNAQNTFSQCAKYILSHVKNSKQILGIWFRVVFLFCSFTWNKLFSTSGMGKLILPYKICESHFKILKKILGIQFCFLLAQFWPPNCRLTGNKTSKFDQIWWQICKVAQIGLSKLTRET